LAQNVDLAIVAAADPARCEHTCATLSAGNVAMSASPIPYRIRQLLHPVHSVTKCSGTGRTEGGGLPACVPR
jgi:hypothetical protein